MSKVGITLAFPHEGPSRRPQVVLSVNNLYTIQVSGKDFANPKIKNSNLNRGFKHRFEVMNTSAILPHMSWVLLGPPAAKDAAKDAAAGKDKSSSKEKEKEKERRRRRSYSPEPARLRQHGHYSRPSPPPGYDRRPQIEERKYQDRPQPPPPPPPLQQMADVRRRSRHDDYRDDYRKDYRDDYRNSYDDTKSRRSSRPYRPQDRYYDDDRVRRRAHRRRRNQAVDDGQVQDDFGDVGDDDYGGDDYGGD
ncbi:MAG: hypothetical protein M1818_007964 [Claussenomyces sp. TS43310]|nr:MAG: hypothetical protein M1818_007964 [Claussenomyces sp. TS43310]